MAFEADLSREILRALNMAKAFNLDPLITGAREADQVVADLKSQNAPVIYNLDFPTRPRTLAPDADEPVRELRARAQASKTPAALEKASSDGMPGPPSRSAFVLALMQRPKKGWSTQNADYLL